MAAAPRQPNPDPEVESLLNDLPPPNIPEECRKEGWGYLTMAGAERDGYATRSTPSTTFQPTMVPCHQCGRPFSVERGIDHAGHKDCDSALVERVSSRHITKEEYDDPIRAMALRLEQMLYAPKPPLGPIAGPCMAKHSGLLHQHRCGHQVDHFGFHECAEPTCHRLWR
jgi:hypothetical protein